MKQTLGSFLESFEETLEHYRNGGGNPLVPEDKVIGKSAFADEQRQFLVLAAKIPSQVLLTGPSGTGKSFLAELIHGASARREQPFEVLNCADLSPELIGSQLFGHERGAFTGATKNHLGFFQRAKRGTIFLDEISEMNTDMQSKLLRVLECGKFRPVGSDRELETNARVIAATNVELGKAIKTNKFRADLFYRLFGFQFQFQPLANRIEDVSELTAYCAARFERLHERDGVYKFMEPAIRKLYQHKWQGNVRELFAVVENALHMASENDGEVGPELIRFPQI